jgi:heat-inducible transcriptional repressor
MYIETGEPVPSRTIARRVNEKLSPASIRMIMADLEDEGYLAQPHTSAGRVPTGKAFESYVRSLTARNVLAAELYKLRRELEDLATVEARVERSSHILTERTDGFGIAAAIPTRGQTLESINLLALGDRRVLVVLSTRDGMVRNSVVTLNDAVSQDELNWIRTYLNQNFGGWFVTDIQRELDFRLKQESAAYDAILKKLTLLYEKGLLDIGLAPEVHVEGASNLIGLDLHLTREKLRELFRALEQKKRILLLLERFLEEPQGELAVHIGLADADPSMAELSLVGLTVNLPGGLSGKIAVLGPLRMNYQRAISAVLHVGQAFGSIRD